MEQKTYNGWTNYETWAVALWLDNEEGPYAYWREQAEEHRRTAPDCRQVQQGIWKPTEAAKFNLADQLKLEVEDASPHAEASMYSDLLNAALSEVNWQEIAENMLDALPEPEKAPEAEPVLYAYTRQQAIADGVLVDVTKTAEEAGIRHPTALTAAVWADYVTVPAAVPWQDESGRLWDILTAFRFAATQANSEREMPFAVVVQNDARGPRRVSLKAVCGPGDRGEPVLTVMLPHED
jgi:hypothetical protein